MRIEILSQLKCSSERNLCTGISDKIVYFASRGDALGRYLCARRSQWGREASDADTRQNESRVLPARRARAHPLAKADVLLESLPAAGTEACRTRCLARSGNSSASLSETAHTRLPRFHSHTQAALLSFFPSLPSSPPSLSLSLSLYELPWFDQLALFLHAQRSRIVQRDVLYLSRLPAYFHRGVLRLLTLSLFCSRTSTSGAALGK